MTVRRILALCAAAAFAATLGAPAFAATPGQGIVTIQLQYDVSDASETFTAGGPGMWSSGWADGQDIEYIAAGETFRILMTKWLHCDDGSGDIQILLSAGEPVGSPTRSGGWAIIGGSGAYDDAVGGGALGAKGTFPMDTIGVDMMIGTVTR